METPDRGSCALCVMPGSSSAWNAQAKQLEASPPVHLSFQQFQARDLPLDLSLTPRKGQGCFDGVVIALDAGSKSSQVGRRVLANPQEPGVEPSCSALLDHQNKLLAQLIEFPEVSIDLANAFEQHPLCVGELLRWSDKQPGGLPSRDPPFPRDAQRAFSKQAV